MMCEPCAAGPSKTASLGECDASAAALDGDTPDADPLHKKVARDCRIPRCRKRRTWGPIGGPPASALYCGRHGKERGYEDVNAKRCEAPGCKIIGPNYGPVGGLPVSALYCGRHGKERGYEDVRSKRCEEPGCKSRNQSYGPTGGLPASGVLCAAHGQQRGYEDVRSKRCEAPWCKSLSRKFGPVGGLPASGVLCAEHGKERGYEDVRSKRCEDPGCKRLNPSHGPVGGLPASGVLCAEHGKERGYEDVITKRCEAPGCTSLSRKFGPVGGLPTSGVLCAEHRQQRGYADVMSKRCEAPGCKSLNQSYGPVGGLPASGVLCATHGQHRGYEDVRSKRCEAPGCKSRPRYGPVGGMPKSATHCSGHGRDKGYEDVLRKRCGSCKLRNFVHRMSNVAQCTECDHTLWPRIHKKEDAVARLLQLAYGNQAVRRELAVSFTGCGIGVDRSACAQTPSNTARIDFVVESASAVAIVEVDEEQHSSYCTQAEISRANAIFVALLMGENIRHVHFVRFNPDAFTIGQKKGRVSLEVRHARLVEVIQEALDSNAPQQTWSLLHMFYDTDEDGRLCIMHDIDTNIQPICIAPIID